MSDEINTLPLVKRLFEMDKTCFIPKYVGDSMEMVRLHAYEEIEQLPLTPWNIRQPAGGAALWSKIEKNTDKIAIQLFTVPQTQE